ncbi:MAG: ABC transporter permease [Mesorhizobium sp.]|uniref:ABC transporter permease n=1 Tax=Mesorhizobium sp. M1D.F.Ca.ET.043.01.1.1 TaxID=2493669 RepID=UPI000F756B51|nr:ABC transporter permease [Mesorhizobium sp. M1D.F.Ca.ET.043.01.1.1]AZO73426.1 ABC transporter permease [Mesorhizobium sp. M1D.F.Ca.ET.043.01.1.1]TJW87895.1 MAG: ABC transporter permease [Mesorhizobium sp.]
MTMSTLETKVASQARPSDALRHLGVGDMSRVAVLIALLIAGQAITPSFLSLANIHVILLAVAAIGIMAYGMTLVVITGEIDLSIAGVAILSCIAGGLLIPTGSAALVIGATLLTGLAIGLINGILVAALGIPSLITTLGMLGISRALANIFSGGQALYPEPIAAYLWLGRGDLAGIPLPVVLLVVLGAAAIALTKYSIFGRALYATGGNVKAAALSGINVVGVRAAVFAISGACAALAGMLESARLSYINPAGFEGMELSVLAVTVLGGAALSGGSGSIIGTVVAALIIGIVNNLLNQLGVSIYLQQVVTAAVILAVVMPGMWQRGIAK